MPRSSILGLLALATLALVRAGGLPSTDDSEQRMARHIRAAHSHQERAAEGAQQLQADLHAFLKRQNVTDGNVQSAANSPTNNNRPTSASTTSSSQPTSSASRIGLLPGVDSGINSLFSPRTSTTTSSTSSLLPVVINLTSTIPPATSSTPVVSVPPETVIQTISLPATSSTAPPSSTALSSSNSSTSSGIGKSTIIIIIVVASCIGGAIAIWTIVRKVKFSPSKQFDRKLAPVDFGDSRRDSDFFDGSQVNFAAAGGYPDHGHGKRRGSDDEKPWPLHRTPSMASIGQHSIDQGSLHRQPSGGAHIFLNRTDSFADQSERTTVGGRRQPTPPQDVYPSMPPQQRSYGNVYGVATGEQQYYSAAQYQHYPGQGDYYAPPSGVHRPQYGGGLDRQGSLQG